MNIVGPPLGKVALVPSTYDEWNINQAIVLFRPKADILSRFLYYLLCSGVTYTDILLETRGSAGQSNISLTQCREMIIPVPSVTEQEEIVNRVEGLFRFADQIYSRFERARAHVERINASLFAKAFNGELLPTEAELARHEGRDYEPASALLERVRQQRVSNDETESALAIRAKASTRGRSLKGPNRTRRRAVISR